MRASIIIPTYNGAAQLPRLLGCLQHISSPNIADVIVCDDGSDDDIRTLLRPFQRDLPVVYLRQERKGWRSAKARNLGIRAASGDVLLFFDHDVVVSQRTIESHLRHHETPQQPRLAFGFRERIVSAASEVVDAAGRYQKAADDHRRSILKVSSDGAIDSPIPWYYAYSCNLSVSRSTENHYFDEAFVGWGNEDLEYAYRLWKHGFRIACAPEATVQHIDQLSMADPYLNEARSLPADFASLIINTVLFLVKHGSDPLVVSTLRKDLVGFRVIGDRCVRDTAADEVDEVIAWARRRLEGRRL